MLFCSANNIHKKIPIIADECDSRVIFAKYRGIVRFYVDPCGLSYRVQILLSSSALSTTEDKPGSGSKREKQRAIVHP